MAYGRRDPDPTPFQGINHGAFGKAFKFQGDFWEEPEFIPVAHSEWVPDPDRTDGGGTMFIADWLVRKNGWKT